MGKTVEGLWDCPYCGEKGIGGLTKECPNCGRPQDVDTKFYIGAKKRYLDEETAKDYGKGADWTCSYCDSLNRYNENVCKGCGASREEADGSYYDNRIKQGADAEELEKSAGKKVELSEKTQKKLAEKEAAEAAKRQAELAAARKKRMPFFIGALVVLIGLLVWIFMPRHAGAEITAKSWMRSIGIEEIKTVEENGWAVPDGGNVIRTQNEIHHYNSVLDHHESVPVEKSRKVVDYYETEYKDNGDGTMEEVEVPVYKKEYYTEYEDKPVYVEVPQYQTKYYYEIDRWFPARTVDTSGGSDEPQWGEVTLADTEREAGREEEYDVQITTEKKKEYTAKLSEEDWNSLKEGDSVEITIQNGHVKKINDNIIPLK